VAIFVDTSALVYVAFQERGHEGVADHLASLIDLPFLALGVQQRRMVQELGFFPLLPTE